MKKFRKQQASHVNVTDLETGILSGSRVALSRAITLIESQHPDHQKAAQELLQLLINKRQDTIRIGITGVPGAGKSTFIEAFGMMLCQKGLKVAVLAIDPTSSLSGGSILGDKTRMEQLSKEKNAYVRPSPTSGTLGGVHKKTRETMLLCEAFGFDVVLVETVGVGQSETAVRGMVDFFMLLTLTGAGDELQGMKKGIMELADAIVIHKADGANEKPAKKTASEFKQILHFIQPATKGWTPISLPVSSYTKLGLEEVWSSIEKFVEETTSSGEFASRRALQQIEWFKSAVTDRLIAEFFQTEGRKEQMKSLQEAIGNSELTTQQALEKLFAISPPLDSVTIDNGRSV